MKNINITGYFLKGIIISCSIISADCILDLQYKYFALSQTAKSLPFPLPKTPLLGVPAPNWYIKERIHIHTRFSIPQNGFKDINSKNAFENANPTIFNIGLNVLTRHIKSNDQPLYTSRSIFTKIKSTNKIIGYYWLSSNKEIELLYPELVCKNIKNSVISHRKRGVYLDLSSSYADFLKKEFSVLADLNLDAIYLDGQLMPKNGCYKTTLEKKFKNLYNTDIVNQKKFLDFQADALPKILHNIKTQSNLSVKRPLVVSVGSLVTLFNSTYSPDIARVGIPKSEFTIPYRQGQLYNIFKKDPSLRKYTLSPLEHQMAGFQFLSTISNNPAHIWLHKYNDFEDLSYKIGVILNSGSVANINIRDESILPHSKLLQSLEDLNKGLHPLYKAMSSSKANPVAIVLNTDALKNRFSTQLESTNWKNVTYPVVKLHSLLSSYGITADIVDSRLWRESRTDYFDKYKQVIIFEGGDNMTPHYNRGNILRIDLRNSDQDIKIFNSYLNKYASILSTRVSSSTPILMFENNLSMRSWINKYSDVIFISILNPYKKANALVRFPEPKSNKQNLCLFNETNRPVTSNLPVNKYVKIPLSKSWEIFQIRSCE